MRRLKLTTILIAVNVALLLLAVAGVAYVAVGLLQRLADEQALERVRHATTIAGQVIDRSGDETHTAALLLAERPTLQRLTQEHDVPALAAFLAQFQQTEGLDGTAVISGGQVLAAGSAGPWARLWATRDDQTGRFMQAYDASAGPLILGAWAALPGQEDAGVLVMQALDDSFARQLGRQIGLPVTVLSRPSVLAAASGMREDLRRRALSGSGQAARLEPDGLYVAAVALASPSGQAQGVVETEMPTTATVRSIAELGGTLILLAVLVAALGAAANLAVGRRLRRPLAALTGAAALIGRGDLATPVPRASGRIAGAEIGLLGSTLEDMRRHLLQLTAELHRKEAEAQAIVGGIVEGVFSVDRERRVRYLNPQGAALLGVRAEDALGRFCGDVLHPRPVEGVRPCEADCPILHARFRGPTRACEHLQGADGKTRTVVITSAPAAGEQQVQVMRDETELEATRRIRDGILANMSHEFRTPLSAQLASIELLQDQLPELNLEQIGQLIASLQRGTLRLTQLVDNLLESARIEAGRDSMRRKPVALDEVVEAALAVTQPLLQMRQQVIEVDLPYPLPPVSGDATRLAQVFVNLLANANKFAPPGSTIRVGGQVCEDSVTLWVDDEGPGLPDPGDPAIFTRFVRATGADEPEQGGAGLGLWIVKSIVERHGGRVEALNRAPGTRFSVVLPLAAQGAAGKVPG